MSVPDDPNVAFQVATWFMWLPNQGIGYKEFLLAVVTLEEIPGRPPPKLKYAGAQYELAVTALDSREKPRVDRPDTWQPMQPFNLVEQFHGVSREQAGRVAETLATACVKGDLVAETQIFFTPFDGSEPRMMFIKQVLDMWTGAVAQLVEHEQTGGLHERAN